MIKELVNYASNTNWLLQKELSCRVYFVVLSDFQVKKSLVPFSLLISVHQCGN